MITTTRASGLPAPNLTPGKEVDHVRQLQCEASGDFAQTWRAASDDFIARAKKSGAADETFSQLANIVISSESANQANANGRTLLHSVLPGTGLIAAWKQVCEAVWLTKLRTDMPEKFRGIDVSRDLSAVELADHEIVMHARRMLAQALANH